MQIEISAPSSDLQTLVNSWHLESIPGGFQSVKVKGQKIFVTRSFWAKTKITASWRNGTLSLKSASDATGGALTIIILGIFFFFIPAIILAIVFHYMGAKLGEDVLRHVQQKGPAPRATPETRPIVAPPPAIAAPATVLCPTCRVTNPADALFCRNCGANLGPQASGPPQPAPSPAEKLPAKPAPRPVPARLSDLRGRYPNLDLREVEARLKAGAVEGAAKLLEGIEGLLKQREGHMVELNQTTESIRRLSIRLASGELNAEAYSTARAELDFQKGELQEKIAEIDSKLFKEEYEKPVF